MLTLSLLFNRCGIGFVHPTDLTDYFLSIRKTLTQCPIHVKLNKFIVDICYNSGVNINTHWSWHINRWIHYAITRKVQEVELLLSDLSCYIVWYDDELFFNNSCITSLKIWECKFDPPNGVICWDKLKSLDITGGELDEDMIENILSGSPVLETLVLHNCYGFKQIDVTSPSVKNLKFSMCDYRPVTIEINAPYILSLTIKDTLSLEKLLLLNMSSLVKAELDYSSNRSFNRTREDIEEEEEEELLKGLLHSLGHVKHIKLGNSRLVVLSRLKAKGFQFFGDADRIPELFASAIDTESDDD